MNLFARYQWFVFLLPLLIAKISFCQQTARMTSGGNGYLEKLPPDYSTNSSRKYPILFFLHGSGEVGNGSPTDLQKVKANGPPYLIEQGHNMCFIVNGVEECFIVISPQLRPGLGGWWPSVLNEVFDYVINGPLNYRIDKTRVYLTGLSLGGQGVYIGVGDAAVPDIFAAGAPVSAFGNGNGCRISSRKIPMWGFHGTADGTIPYSTGLQEFNNIVNCTSPTPTAELKWTPYVGLGHNVWQNYAYRTDNNLHTPNLYQWLLTKTKGGAPKANAGADLTLVLPTNSASLSGSGSDTGGGTIVSYSWTKVSGGAANLTNANTPTLSVTDLVEGIYVFRLTVTDNDGNTAFDDVSVTVTLAVNLIITNPNPVCAPSTVDITQPAVTAGSTPGITLSYWIDLAATTPLLNPTSVGNGVYYIKAITATGGSMIKPVTAIVNPSPNLIITNPPPNCEGVTFNLTTPSLTAGSSIGLTLSYWKDSSGSVVLSNPTAVGSGTYYVKGTNSFGCAIIKPATLTTNPTPSLIVQQPAPVCSPLTVNITAPSITTGSASNLSLSYWTDSSATSVLANPATCGSGTFFIKGTDTNGCSSVKPINVTINPSPVLQINPPLAVCAPATIDLTSPAVTSGSTGSASLSYWLDANATNPVILPSQVGTGTYYVKALGATGCSVIKSITVYVNQPPTLVVTTPTPVCEPTKVDLTSTNVTAGSTSGSFSYWLDGTATLPVQDPTSISTSGTYFIKSTDGNNCYQVKPVIVVINPKPTMAAGNSFKICSGQSTEVSLSTANSVPSLFSWTSQLVSGNASGFFAGSGNTISQLLTTDNFGAAVKYVVTPTSINGSCKGNPFEVTVDIGPVPIASINTTASSSVICNGCSTNVVVQNLNQVANTTFSWTASVLAGSVNGHSNGAGSSIVQSLSKTTIDGTVRYQIVPKAGICTGQEILFDVRVNNPPIANAGANRTIKLPSDPITLIGSATDNDGQITATTWAKVAGPASYSISNDNTLTPQVSNLTEGIYQFRLLTTDNDGAIAISTTTITVVPKENVPPIVNAGTDITVKLPILEVKLNGSAIDPDGNIVSRNWKQTDGRAAKLTANQDLLTVSDLLVGEYVFQFSATDNQGATSSSSLKVTILPADDFGSFKRAKFITPNGDQVNDYWILDPDITKYERCRFIILSNSGEKVFETFGYKNDWNGTRNGAPLPQDVYYYICECADKKDSGDITIIR
ncbi:MAG: gliding motility-associated C-terminal domain-containing protein [Bacteroidetes bacterium]|nr:gliding motility-associated C-terminal domain-containing protein [Bacteroidota bacterium]